MSKLRVDTLSPLDDSVSVNVKDLISTATYSLVPTFADLKAFIPLQAGAVVELKEYYANTGKGGGLFVARAGSPVDNAGTIIVPTGSASLYWSRLVDGPVNAYMFGAVGDGVADDSVPVSNMMSSPYDIQLPSGTFKISGDPQSVISKTVKGPGVIKGSDGAKRGKIFTSITSAPTSLGNENSILTAFDGDNSKSPFQIEHRITGAATLGQPSTGYTYQPESIPNYTYFYNASGWNESLSGNDGRTGTAAYRAKVDQYGQGDAVCFNGSAFVAGTKVGSTNFLANPAAVLFNGDMTAGSDGVYLNPHEVILHDNGNDIAAVGFVGNFSRTVGTGAKTAIWHGARYQSVGSASCDAIISASGGWKVGLDFTQATTTFGVNQAAISLRGGQRIYLNNASNESGNTEAGWHTTVFNGDYISYDTDHITVAAGGNPNLQISPGRVTIASSQVGFTSAGKTSNSATSGGGTTLPGKVAFFLTVYFDGTPYKIPVFNN